MTISQEREAEILRLYHAEKWCVGTIATQLGLHHGVVERVLGQAGVLNPERPPRPSIADPYIPFVKEILEKYPRLTASRLFDMVTQRGYAGGPDHFRAIVARIRPRKPAEAYLRLRTLPGEQAQVDWGHFGKLAIGRALRPLMAFVMVLSFSRMVFLRFYLDARMPNFIRGHVDAFNFFQGVARVLLYDNLKSAVLERRGDAIRFHPKLLELSGHYHYEPRPVAPARGNEKGRVERKIRDARESFFAARKFADLADLNAQALDWCTGRAANRPCPEDKRRKVHEVFAEEQKRLLPLPEVPFETAERIEVEVHKVPYVRFDLNDYSIPHTKTQRTLTVLADLETVRVLDGAEVIASHPRSFDKGAQVENSRHVADLREHKRRARQESVLDHLQRAVPGVTILLERAAERGANLGILSTRLYRLLDAHGAAELQEAVAEALVRQTPHLGAVRQLLDYHRRQRGQPPPLAVELPADVRVREMHIPAHDLNTYDQLSEDTDDNDTNE
jgi:transposase